MSAVNGVLCGIDSDKVTVFQYFKRIFRTDDGRQLKIQADNRTVGCQSAFYCDETSCFFQQFRHLGMNRREHDNLILDIFRFHF